ncbi:MAG: septation protein SpoVG family protein [Candidatus Binatia bacterium]
MSALVQVLAIKPLSNAGNLRAFASVKLGDIIIHDCRVVQQPGQRAWVSLPQCEYTRDSEKKYAAIVELSDTLKRELSHVVLTAWEQERMSDAGR